MEVDVEMEMYGRISDWMRAEMAGDLAGLVVVSVDVYRRYLESLNFDEDEVEIPEGTTHVARNLSIDGGAVGGDTYFSVQDDGFSCLSEDSDPGFDSSSLSEGFEWLAELARLAESED